MRASERKTSNFRSRRKSQEVIQPWVSVGARVTFRAEVMPGHDTDERTFTVARVGRSGRVELSGLSGEHTRTEFESAR
jgi:hypothetical protein